MIDSDFGSFFGTERLSPRRDNLGSRESFRESLGELYRELKREPKREHKRKHKLDLAFNYVKPKEKSFVFD